MGFSHWEIDTRVNSFCLQETEFVSRDELVRVPASVYFYPGFFEFFEGVESFCFDVFQGNISYALW